MKTFSLMVLAFALSSTSYTYAAELKCTGMGKQIYSSNTQPYSVSLSAVIQIMDTPYNHTGSTGSMTLTMPGISGAEFVGDISISCSYPLQAKFNLANTHSSMTFPLAGTLNQLAGADNAYELNATIVNSNGGTVYGFLNCTQAQ